jgi:MFS family permease
MQNSTQSRRTLRLFLPLYLPSFLFSFSSSLLIPVLPLYAQGFHVSYGLVGVILAGDAIGMLIGDVPAGMFLRRLGQKGSMVIGLVLSGFSTAGLFWASSILAVLVLRILAGMGASLFNVSRHYFLTEMAPPADRGRVTSIFGGAFRLGRLLGPIAGGVLANGLGLRASFLLFGVVCLLALAIVIYFLPKVEVTVRDGSPTRPVSAVKRMARMLKEQYRVLATAGAGCLFIQLIRTGPTVIIPLYAANSLNLGVETIGLIISVSAALDMLLFFPAGIVMDRWGRKAAILPSCVFLSAGIALIPFTSGFSGLLLAGILSGFGNGLGSGSMLTLGSDLSPHIGRSEFLGAWNLIGDMGGTSGPLVIGNLAEGMPLAQTGWIVALGGIAALLIFSLLVPETLQKGLPAAQGELL